MRLPVIFASKMFYYKVLVQILLGILTDSIGTILSFKIQILNYIWYQEFRIKDCAPKLSFHFFLYSTYHHLHI